MSGIAGFARRIAGTVLDPIIGGADAVIEPVANIAGVGDGPGSGVDKVITPITAPQEDLSTAIPEMPVAPGGVSRNDRAARDAARKARERIARRHGRASTILTPFSIERENVLGE